jgi:hypothetical protein
MCGTGEVKLLTFICIFLKGGPGQELDWANFVNMMNSFVSVHYLHLWKSGDWWILIGSMEREWEWYDISLGKYR